MTRYKLKDVIQRVNTKEDRFNTDLEYYVGGDHIDTDSLLLTRYGLISEGALGPMFYFGFKAGDTLLVSRNPHLRKACKSTISGICSEKTFVLGTIDESILLNDFIPIILQSDDFWDYAEKNKSGSVNFFINWSTLANYVFDLPSIDQQKAAIDLVWSTEDLIQELTHQKELLDLLVKSRFIEMFGNLDINDKHWEMSTIGNSASVPLHYGSIASAVDYDSEIRYVRITDIDSDGKLTDDFKSPSIYDSSYLLNKGDILFARSGSVGVTYLFDEDYKSIFAGYLIRFIPDKEKLDPEFAYQFTRSAYCQGILVGNKRGGVQKNVNAKQLSAIPIPLPPMDLQKEFVDFIHQVDKSKIILSDHLENTRVLQKSLINIIMGGGSDAE